MDVNDFRNLAKIHRIMANETRLAIIWLIKENSELTVGEITSEIGLDQSTISKHLSLMTSAQVTDYRKEGNKVYYRLIMPCILDMLICSSSVLKKN